VDGSSFDRIAKTLAAGRSRRSVVKALAGGVAGGVVALLGGAAGGAGRCKTVGQVCKTTADCCPGALGNGNVWCGPSGKQKACQACPAGTVACNGGCVDVGGSDNANCGACGAVCTGGTSCTTGACACPTGQSLCGGQCVDTTASDTNCGGCGRTCPAGTGCTGGLCCLPGQDVCAGACTDVQNNNANCGACGHACDPGLACAGGTCTCSLQTCPIASLCHCHDTTDGPVCAGTAFTNCTTCASAADCPAGQVCVTDSGICGGQTGACASIGSCPAF
jgi:hypothetical protein